MFLHYTKRNRCNIIMESDGRAEDYSLSLHDEHTSSSLHHHDILLSIIVLCSIQRPLYRTNRPNQWFMNTDIGNENNVYLQQHRGGLRFHRWGPLTSTRKHFGDAMDASTRTHTPTFVLSLSLPSKKILKNNIFLFLCGVRIHTHQIVTNSIAAARKKRVR